MSVTILGLGHGDPRALTLEAIDALAGAHEIFLRTKEHPTVAALPKHLRIHSFDHVYESQSNFDSIYSAIAGEIIKRGAQDDVLYAVPGHPMFAEITVQKILSQARAKNISTRVIAGVSFVDAVCAALELDPLAHGMQIADATDVARQHFPHLDTDQPALIGQVYSRAIASDCKLTLMVLYPPDHNITRIDGAGTANQKIETIPLAELDRVDDFGLLTTVYIPPMAHPSSTNALGEVVGRLRAPDGCPWDRAQTHQSLRKDFLEECYEVLETLDEDDMPHLQEELGDLLLHIFLQAQIASESGEFTLSDVVADISEKLIRRHPHVFGDVKVSGTAEIIANWETIKQRENGGRKKASIPPRLPALMRAQKVAKKAKITPNIQDIGTAIARLPRTRKREQAIGEILFALAAYAASKHIDAETALRVTANSKFVRRE